MYNDTISINYLITIRKRNCRFNDETNLNVILDADMDIIDVVDLPVIAF